MTHIHNVPHILTNGITHRNSLQANPGYESIGDGSLIKTRDEKLIWVNNGERFSFDHEQIKLGNYTPFYFGSRMPMLFVIQKGFNGVIQQPPENIVYCVCTLQAIINSGNQFYFTDGHAIDNLSSCYKSDRVNDLKSVIDFNAVKATDWTTGRDLKRKMEAELLLADDLPVKNIAGFACCNENAKKQLVEMGVDETMAYIRPNFYF